MNVLLDHGAVMQDIDEFRLTLAEEIFKLSSPLFDGTLLEVSGRPFKDAYKILCCIRLSRLQSEQIAPSLREQMLEFGTHRGRGITLLFNACKR